jgi:hypothetical protein
MRRDLLDITPEEVEAAYVKKGLLPRAGSAVVVRGKCCALGVLMKGFNLGKSYEKSLLDVGISAKLPVEFGSGFDAGFNSYPSKKGDSSRPYFAHGYKVGQHIRKL